MRLRLLITSFACFRTLPPEVFGLDLTVILPAAAMDPMVDLGWEWLIGWGILAGGLITVLRVMVRKDKIVLTLGNVEENPDGTMTVVCAGYQNKKPLPLDLSHVRVRKGSALIFRQSQSSDLDDCQLTIVLDALAELSVEVGPAKLIISQSRLRAGR